MGQKVHPISYRLGVNQDWSSSWTLPSSSGTYDYSLQLAKDLQIKKVVQGILSEQGNCLLANFYLDRNLSSIHFNPELVEYTCKKKLTLTIDVYLFQKALENFNLATNSNDCSNQDQMQIKETTLMQEEKKEQQGLLSEQEEITNISFLSQNSTENIQMNPNQDNIEKSSEDLKEKSVNSSTSTLVQQSHDAWIAKVTTSIQSCIKKQVEPSLDLSKIQIHLRTVLQQGTTYQEKDTHFLQFCFSDFNANLLCSWLCQEVQRRKGVRDLVNQIESSFWTVQKNCKSQPDLCPMIPTGIRITCSGRFLMTDNEKRRNKMARQVTFQKGTISLTSIDKQIAYSNQTAFTVDGASGIKVWISYGQNTKYLKPIFS
uniref:Ribosomal protein S3 n=1 Tax=Jakoba libera TaxID=143017 RepID=M4QCC5_JAKLI|nr:ribosomal protein S3 [Jakoba libera]AGH24209.1 ribosomal protein S3 [Jakoba libera]